MFIENLNDNDTYIHIHIYLLKSHFIYKYTTIMFFLNGKNVKILYSFKNETLMSWAMRD